MPTYNKIVEITLFEPTEKKDTSPICQNTTKVGIWNKVTKQIDGQEIVFDPNKKYSFQVYESQYKTDRGKTKFNMRISEVIDDGSSYGSGFTPNVNKFDAPF